MATIEVRVDRATSVRTDPRNCHNRWHPDIPPILRCAPGDELLVEARDSVDGQITRDSGHTDVTRLDRSIVHALTGPFYVESARPGDALLIDIIEVTTASFGYTAQIPGFGLLRDEFPEPFVARWDIEDGQATSPDLPGVTLPGAPFMGVMGVAPSRELLRAVLTRESELSRRGVTAFLPDANGAIPAEGPMATEGLRTMPPRENGGNFDVKHLVAGTRLHLPVWVEGALLSVGDGHFAQGDGEVCGTAVETATTVRLRVDVQPGNGRDPATRAICFEGSQPTGARPFFATVGLSRADPDSRAEDLTDASRQAVRHMIDYLTSEHALSPQQAYALCSVAADLSVSEVVDVPTVAVTAMLPLDIFTP